MISEREREGGIKEAKKTLVRWRDVKFSMVYNIGESSSWPGTKLNIISSVI